MANEDYSEASDLMDGLPADNIGGDNTTNEDYFSDEALGLDTDDKTGEDYTPEDHKETLSETEEPKQTAIKSDDYAAMLAEKGLDKYKDVGSALDGLVNLNSKFGELGSKLEGYGQLQERNKILEEHLEKLFDTADDGSIHFSESAVKTYMKLQKKKEPQKSQDEIMDDLENDFQGTLDKLIESKVGGKLKKFDDYLTNQKVSAQNAEEQAEREGEADELFNHYMENEPGFKENIKQVDEILEANPSLYNLEDPLGIVMQMLKKADNIAAKKRADGTFVESSRTQKTEPKTQTDIDFEEIYAQQTNAGSLLAG